MIEVTTSPVYDVTVYSADAENPVQYYSYRDIPTWLEWARLILEHPTFERLTYTCGLTETKVERAYEGDDRK